MFSGVAVAATGIAVSSGVVGAGTPSLNGAALAIDGSHPVKSLSAADLADREQAASRSSDDRRAEADSAKSVALADTSGVSVRHTEDLADADPRTLTKALMPSFGMNPNDFGCVDDIVMRESKWNVHADNPSSSAYGIPQALPGSKMASAGPDWENNPETQIKWMLGYLKSRYGSPCSAWAFKSAHGWY